MFRLGFFRLSPNIKHPQQTPFSPRAALRATNKSVSVNALNDIAHIYIFVFLFLCSGGRCAYECVCASASRGTWQLKELHRYMRKGRTLVRADQAPHATGHGPVWRAAGSIGPARALKKKTQKRRLCYICLWVRRRLLRLYMYALPLQVKSAASWFPIHKGVCLPGRKTAFFVICCLNNNLGYQHPRMYKHHRVYKKDLGCIQILE